MKSKSTTIRLVANLKGSRSDLLKAIIGHLMGAKPAVGRSKTFAADQGQEHRRRCTNPACVSASANPAAAKNQWFEDETFVELNPIKELLRLNGKIDLKPAGDGASRLIIEITAPKEATQNRSTVLVMRALLWKIYRDLMTSFVS